jgi:hypothetical protein
MFTQKGELKAGLGLTEKRAKGILPDEKASRIKKKELLTPTSGNNADWRNESDDNDDG